MKVFYYDTSHFNTTYNTKGRLASAGTCSNPTCAGPWITAEDFSYSARGDLTDIYELTPNSGGWYHVTQTYWPHGAPSQLSGLPGLPTISYGGTIGSTVGLDGEGRITQVTASSGQNPVTGVSYNTASLPTQVNLGSGDSDIFAYDANTLRMNQYQFRINGQYVTSAVTWNANGSLGQLAITDPFNSANTQTCNYAHDDVARIAQVDCGTSNWGQSFAYISGQNQGYDPFGNLTKYVLSNHTGNSFQPTYNSATNRFSSIPGCSALSYDNKGNVLNDCNHTYAWDADGNSVTVDSVGLTFDALDRVVEQNRSGSYTQIVYAPTGAKLALMNGQTLQRAYIRLPGTATAVYTATAPLDHYQHADWLGSSRLGSQPYAAPPWSETAYAPFGEPYAQLGATDLSFTGQNSDTSSGDYDFLAREYSTQGRWASPDPAGLAAVDPSNPQTWNRYAYVTNNPMTYIDPLGLREDMPGQCPQVSIDGNPVYDDFGGCAVGGWLVRAILSMDAGAMCPDGNCNLIRQGPDGNWQIYVQQDDPSLCTGSAWICVGATGQWTSANLNSLSSGGGGTFLGWTWDDWGVFGRTFLNGVFHGVRQPGQSRAACIDQNVRETTGIDPSVVYNKTLVTAEAVAMMLAAHTGPPGQTNGLQMAAFGIGGAAARLVRVAAVARPVAGVVQGFGYGLAIAGAATVGVTVGSAINCR